MLYQTLPHSVLMHLKGVLECFHHPNNTHACTQQHDPALKLHCFCLGYITVTGPTGLLCNFITVSSLLLCNPNNPKPLSAQNSELTTRREHRYKSAQSDRHHRWKPTRDLSTLKVVRVSGWFRFVINTNFLFVSDL